MFNSENQAIILNAEDKSLAPRGPVPNAAGLIDHFRDDGLKSPIMTINCGLLLNNRLVPPGQEPKSWRDLADPKWKRKILSDDMRAVGGGYVAFFVTAEKAGQELSREVGNAGYPVHAGDVRRPNGAWPVGKWRSVCRSSSATFRT
jgi:iron(III) transport system substrate-binding protein